MRERREKVGGEAFGFNLASETREDSRRREYRPRDCHSASLPERSNVP